MKTIRIFFILLIFVSFNHNKSTAQQREVVLSGTYNFRDIGGFKTTDNKTIKWGKIYRSAKLTDLTAHDLKKLEDLKIARVADLRSPGEMHFFPDKLPQHAILFRARNTTYKGGQSKNTVEDDWTAMANEMKTYSVEETDKSVIKYYRGLANTFKDRYKPIFDTLLTLSPDSAIVFHCTGGKDRSGVVAAMIEYVLGVKHNQIVEDFVLTNKYREVYNKKIANMLTQKYGVPAQRATAYGISKGKYLEATFNEIEKRYGSLDNFVENELGLTKNKIALLRSKYLE